MNRQLQSALPPGTVVAQKYVVEGVAGEGASGVVHKAVMQASDGSGPVPLALKVLHPHLTGEESLRRRFLREARILAHLEDAHLVKLLDAGELADGRLYLALEWVEGHTLDRYLSTSGALPADLAVAVGRKIARAIEHAHRLGIVHRDLKPSNVVLESMDPVKLRVLDFGMAKLLGEELRSSPSAITDQNLIFGTPEYMAPEQARGDELDHRVDVYALGVMLYEMLTGRAPFSYPSPLATMTAQVRETPVPPSRLVSEGVVSPALEAVVLGAMQKDRALRFSSMAELANALHFAREAPADADRVQPRGLRAMTVNDTLVSTPPSTDRDSFPSEPEDRIAAPERPAPPPTSSDPRSVGRSLDDDRLSWGPGWILVGVAALLVGLAAGVIMALSAAR